MDGLRWLLLLFGVLIIVGVYAYSRRERDKHDIPRVAPGTEHRVEPTLDPNADEIEDEILETDSESETTQRETARPQKIVTLRLVAKRHGSFPGDDLVLSLRSIGLRHGKFGIFHRYDGDDEHKVVFSAASLVEPGSFDLENIKDQKIPGISLFMVLPGPLEGAQAFDLMMTGARALSRELDAELLDESGSTLSVQRERYLREEIIQYQHGIKVA
jgi:cell division protein ZipA